MRTEDGRIIQECLNGEREAFGVLVDKYKEGIYAFVYARLRDFQDAQDVTQEVFLQAYRGLRRLRRSESFAFWLYRIAYVCCAQCLRASSKRVDREFIEDQSPKAMNASYLDSYRADQLSESVREALDSLPEAYREVLMLHYFGGMNSSEMARALGTSPVAIRKRLSRARAHLKEEMISAMGTAFEQQRLRTGFTFHIIEAIKRIRINPIPRMTGLPWGLSLAAGIMFTVLSLSPNSDILAPGITSMGQSPDHAEMVRVGEIPVDILTVPEEPIFPGYPGEMYDELPSALGAQGHAAFSMAPDEQGEYNFVRSIPEELLGVRGGKLSIDESGNIYAPAGSRVQKYDPEGKLLMSFGTFGSGDGQFARVGGMDVDISGNIYAFDPYENCVQKFDPDGKFLMKWGTSGDGDGQFNYPVDLAVDDSGNVYVPDSYNYRVQKFDSEGKFLLKWGTQGDGDGQFLGLVSGGITVDSSGNVYVADTDNNRIQVFDSEGNFLRKWGTKGDGNGQFQRPLDVALDSLGDVYVSESGKSGIQKFDSQGNFLEKLGASANNLAIDSSGNIYGSSGNGIKKYDSEGNLLKHWDKPSDLDGQFTYPNGLDLDESGNLYVADTQNHRIQKLDPDGNFLTTWGTLGTGNGQFSNPKDIALDSSRNVYTIEQASVPHTHRVQKFDSEGKFLKSWGGMGSRDGQLGSPRAIDVDETGNVYVGELLNCRVQKFDSEGKFLMKWGTQGDGDGQFLDVESIAVDHSGDVYVLDTFSNRVQVFNSEGKFLRKWGSQGDADGEFNRPQGIAVDSRSGRVYVSDTYNHRIQVFDTKGNFLAKWGTYGDGYMGLSYPKGIAVSLSGDVYVCDAGNNRIKVYRPIGGGAVEPGGKQLGKWGEVKRTELYQNFPNPFNPETWIPFSLSESEHVTIRIYGLTGQLVRTLDLGQILPGEYLSKEKAAYWDGRNETGETVASDVYFYAMEAGGFTTTRKMVVMR